MSFRNKAYQTSEITGQYPLATLPIHADQIGDILWPRKLVPRSDRTQYVSQTNIGENLFQREPSDNGGGPFHMIKNTTSRFSVLICKLAEELGMNS